MSTVREFLKVAGEEESVDEKLRKINEIVIENYEIYYRYANEKHIFVWNDDMYSMKLYSSVALSNEEILLILEGITIQ